MAGAFLPCSRAQVWSVCSGASVWLAYNDAGFSDFCRCFFFHVHARRSVLVLSFSDWYVIGVIIPCSNSAQVCNGAGFRNGGAGFRICRRFSSVFKRACYIRHYSDRYVLNRNFLPIYEVWYRGFDLKVVLDVTAVFGILF